MNLYHTSKMPKNNRILQGWGLANQNNQILWASDGTSILKSVDIKTWKHINKHKIIKQNGQPLNNINELEIIQESDLNKGISNYIFANAFHSNSVYMINLKSGQVVKEWDFGKLLEHQEKHVEAKRATLVQSTDDKDKEKYKRLSKGKQNF